jgi:outer membrane receptor protein involved in Fe transport
MFFNSRKNFQALRGVLLLGTSFAASTTCAHAQTSSAPAEAPDAPVGNEASTGEIVVTAQKRRQNLSDVPISVTALTGEQLVEKGIDDVADLVKVTPGLSVQEGSRGVPVISIRGIGFSEEAIGGRPTVSVYIDEAPLAFPIMAKSAAFDLERVEVLKGPQGTLFGQSSTGGAINYIAGRPTDNFEGNFTASYERFDTVELEGYVSGPIAPTLNARLAVRTVQGGDRQYSYVRDDTIGNKNFKQGRLTLEFEPSADFRVQLMATGFHDKSEPYFPQFIATTNVDPGEFPLLDAFPVAPNDPRATEWDPSFNYRLDNKFYQGVLRADYDLSDVFTLTSLTSYAHMDVFGLRGDGTNLGNFDTGDSGELETISQEVRLSGELGPLNFIVGANYQHDETYQLLATLTRYATVTAFIGDGGAVRGSQDFDTVAAFADGTYEISDQLRLNAGVRYTRQDLDYKACLLTLTEEGAALYTGTLNFFRAFGLPPELGSLGPIDPLEVGQCASLDAQANPAEAVGNLTEDNISWRLGIDFKPTPETLVYANIRRGYKAGSIPVPGASSIEQFNPVTQESVLAYEAGLKTSLFDRAISFAGAGFYYDYTDKQLLGQQVFDPDIFGPQATLVNIPKSRVYGGEAELTVRPAQGLSLGFAGTYIESEVQSDFLNVDVLENEINFRGREFPITPKWQLVFNGDYNVPVSQSLNGLLGFDILYRSATKASFGDVPELDIDGYTTLDLRAGVEDADGRWRVLVFGRNVFNEYYWTSVIGSSNVVRRFAGPPATYGVQLGVNF